MNVFVVTINHRYGQNVSVHSTRKKALDAVARYVLEWWHELSRPMYSVEKIPDNPESMSRNEILDIYFTDNDEEWYEINSAKVD